MTDFLSSVSSRLRRPLILAAAAAVLVLGGCKSEVYQGLT